MRSYLLLSFFLLGCTLYAQTDSTGLDDTDQEEELSFASPQATRIMIDLSNPNDIDLALKKIQSYKNLDAVILDGETDEATLQKVLYRLASVKSITSLTMRNNEISKVPDNLKIFKSLQSLTIEGNPELDYNDLCGKLSVLQLTELHLSDNDLKREPPPFGMIRTLKKIEITGSEQLDYEKLVDELARIPELTSLQIPVNYMTQLPKNITLLKTLQVLDVSNNVLTEMPQEVSSLKAINNLSIQGNLLLNPVKDLEKFKDNDIRYLSLDRELSADEIGQIKKMFPDAEIRFPAEEKEDTGAEQQQSATEAGLLPKKENFGELSVKKEMAILSTAYLSYPALFRGLVYNFDTLNMEERYSDLSYSNVYRNGGGFYIRKWCTNFEHPGKRYEKWFRFPYDNQQINTDYPELRAFSGMYWVYDGELSKKQFRKKFLTKRQHFDYGNMRAHLFKRRLPIRWNDIRIEYNKNNSLFTIVLKCDTGFVRFNAYPVLYGVPIEKSQQNYNRRFLLYQKGLLRRSQSFKRQLTRERSRYDNDFKKLSDYAWKELLLRMSNEEKLMSREEWLDYYDNIVANEIKAISNASLARSYLIRALSLKDYYPTGMGTAGLKASANMGLRPVNVDFIDASGLGKLAVANIIVLDNKEKFYYQQQGTLGLAPNNMTLQPQTGCSVIVEMRNGDFGVVSADELDKQLMTSEKVCQLKVKTIDRNLGTIGELLAGCGIN